LRNLEHRHKSGVGGLVDRIDVTAEEGREPHTLGVVDVLAVERHKSSHDRIG
jgi:hypothetical protein